MKFYFLLFLNVLCIPLAIAQVENSKDIIVKNQVKSSEERHCFYNSSESCTVFFKTFDKRGNVTEWNMGRIAGFYKHQYDDKNRKIASFWVNKSDNSKVDTLLFSYDRSNEIVFENNSSNRNTVYKNSYDRKNRLKKRTSIFINRDKDSILETDAFTWTNFDKLKSRHHFTTKLADKKDTLYSSSKTYEYDLYNNLTKEIHYEDNEVVNTICYEYDSKLRLIQKKEYNTKYIEFRNKEYADYKKPIEYFSTKITYDAKGRIKEKYTYFSDPCMSLDNHFTFKHYYKSNDLLNKVEVFEEGKPRFTISYAYTFY